MTPLSKPSRAGFRVLCISMYDRDVEQLDDMVAALKARGLHRANRSMLIRFALRAVSVAEIREAELYDSANVPGRKRSAR